MKKILVVALVGLMSISMLSGCASKATTKTGLGHSTVISKATNATTDAAGLFQADTIMAAVSVDSNGKIVSVTIDKVQPKMNFGTDGKATTAVDTVVKSAVELGDEYGMVKFGKAVAEWDKQMESLEKWMVGKTIAQVKAMKVTAEGKSEEADLKSSVTVGVSSYIVAVEEAVKNAK